MEPAIDISGLSVTFDTRQGPVRALQNLSLRVEQGQVFGFIGPNGAGKTTAIHVLLGFTEAAAGTARIFGMDTSETFARARIGYLAENPDTYTCLTGRELLHMAGCRAKHSSTAFASFWSKPTLFPSPTATLPHIRGGISTLPVMR